MTVILPWICESCGNEWVDTLLQCWLECPECGSEAAFHEKTRALNSTDVWYTEDENS